MTGSFDRLQVIGEQSIRMHSDAITLIDDVYAKKEYYDDDQITVKCVIEYSLEKRCGMLLRSQK